MSHLPLFQYQWRQRSEHEQNTALLRPSRTKISYDEHNRRQTSAKIQALEIDPNPFIILWCIRPKRTVFHNLFIFIQRYLCTSVLYLALRVGLDINVLHM